MKGGLFGIKTREQLVQGIAEGLQHHSGIDSGSVWYVDLTDQTVTVHVDSEFGGGEWPKEGDEVVEIDPVAPGESFSAMEEFAGAQPKAVSSKLGRALGGRRPFARFRATVAILDLKQDWYAFRDKWFASRAEEWMRDKGIDFVDGRIVCTGRTWTWEGDEDESGFGEGEDEDDR